MKKIIALGISLLLFGFVFAGCGENGESRLPVDLTGVTEPPQETQPAPTEMITEEPTDPPTQPPVKEVSVRPAEWENVQWQQYTGAYFTLTIPAGWQVQTQGDANAMEWMATSPDGKIGIYNVDHTYSAKDASMRQSLGFNTAIANGTVQEYFEAMYADSTDYFTVQSSCVPNNKELIQSVRPYTPIHDYKSLYATFKDSTVGEGEGIYSAVVMDSKDVVFNGQNYGAWEINCVLTQWAPFGQLVNWAPTLAAIAQSFQYTDLYLQQWRQIANDVTATPTNTVSDTDPVMEAFEERSKSDTIIQEKRSDMLEEYERVYDNDTGEIYRAYSGFLDDMGDQNRYTAITDNQYAEGYVGWIDKD